VETPVYTIPQVREELEQALINQPSVLGVVNREPLDRLLFRLVDPPVVPSLEPKLKARVFKRSRGWQANCTCGHSVTSDYFFSALTL